jgi:hypothetical protein
MSNFASLLHRVLKIIALGKLPQDSYFHYGPCPSYDASQLGGRDESEPFRGRRRQTPKPTIWPPAGANGGRTEHYLNGGKRTVAGEIG